MGSFSFNNGSWQGRVDYSVSNYTGYSTVTATFYDKYYKSAQLSGGFFGWFEIGGNTETFSYARYSAEWANRASRTLDIPVGQDGYADVRIAVTVQGEVTLSGERTIRVGNGTAYGKKSNVALSPSSVKMGEDIIITTSGGEGTIKHTFRYTYGTQTTKQLIAKDILASMTWTVPDLCAYTEKGDYLTVYCETFTSDRSLGETNAKIMVYPPDATKPSMGTSEMGREATIETPRGSGNYSVSLSWKMAGQTGVIQEKAKTDSVKWTPPLTMAKLIPGDWTGSMTLVCDTYNGQTLIGQNLLAVQLNVPNIQELQPSIASMVETLENGHLPEVFRPLLIQKRAHLDVTVEASTDYSEIAAYRFQIGTDAVSAITGHALFTRISSSGSVDLVCTVTDKRGLASSIRKTLQVLPYTEPRIIPYTGNTEILVSRANAAGQVKKNGEFLAIQCGKRCTELVIGEENRNKARLQWRIRRTDGEWGEWGLLLGEDSASQFCSELISGAVSDTMASYDIELRCTDTIGGEHLLSFMIRTDAVSFVLYDGEDGAAFGKFPEGPHMVEVAKHMELVCRGNARFEGTVYFPGSTWKDMGLYSGVSAFTGMGNHPYGGVRYRVENHNRVYVEIAVDFTTDSRANKVEIAEIPEEIIPKDGTPAPSCFARYRETLGIFTMDFPNRKILFNGLFPAPLEPSSYPFRMAGICGEISYFMD